MDVSELPGYLEALQARVAAKGATPAVMAMARTYRREVLKMLSMSAHAPGTFPTPAPAFIAPPAMTTGRLRSSVRVAEGAAGGVVATASVAPHTIYAGVQEWGRTIRRKNRPYMSWVANGRRWYRTEVYVPDRPYMRPSLAVVAGNGSLTRHAMEAFETAVWG